MKNLLKINSVKDVYREVLEIHLAEEGAIVQHCRGGIALVMASLSFKVLLGVSEADVMHDYL